MLEQIPTKNIYLNENIRMAETLEVTTQDQPADMAGQKIYDPSSLWQRLAQGKSIV
jgi:hypothetical protein